MHAFVCVNSVIFFCSRFYFYTLKCLFAALFLVIFVFFILLSNLNFFAQSHTEHTAQHSIHTHTVATLLILPALTMAGVTVQRNSICQQALICYSFYCYCAILLEIHGSFFSSDCFFFFFIFHWICGGFYVVFFLLLLICYLERKKNDTETRSILSTFLCCCLLVCLSLCVASMGYFQTFCAVLSCLMIDINKATINFLA